MADRIRVDFGRLATAEADLTRTAGELQGVLDQLQEEMAGDDPQWSGAAHDAFVRSRSQWQRQMSAVQQALTGTASVLGNVNTAYQQTEDTIAKLF